MYVISLSSEFPNDNPALHDGVIWVCDAPTGAARPERVFRVAACVPSRPATEVETAHGVSRPAADDEAERVTAHASSRPAADDEVEMATAHASSRPAADDEVDDPAPIVVEDLEPLEAVSVEGFATTSTEVAAREVEVGAEIAAALVAEIAEIAEIAGIAEAASMGELPTLEPGLVDEPSVAPPVAAVSQVVLASSRTPDEEQEPWIAAATPEFEELAEGAVAARDATELPAASDDPFTVLVCSLADVAIAAGSPYVASLLPGLMFDGRLPRALNADAAAALRSAGLLEGDEVSATFLGVMSAWREILRGTSDDFGSCGPSMLDEWAAALLAGLIGAPAKASELRQALRCRGVAAFGLVELAA